MKKIHVWIKLSYSHATQSKSERHKLHHIAIWYSVYREFRKYGNFNVKVIYDRNMPHDRRDERFALINFDTHEQAR